jgi:glycosyltransferase involved in cell wall biosynthesis
MTDQPRKKRILFLTDYAGINTGFGKNIKLLLSHLYRTGKYDLCNACCGLSATNPDFAKFPWKTVGVIPNDQGFHQRMQNDPNFARLASYGEQTIQNIVSEFKPDVVFAIQDSWGALFVTEKPFFKKIPTVCWITFDSLPLLKDTVDKASKIKNYWCWADFAQHEFERLGFNHVKTQYPLTNTDKFYPLTSFEKNEIRKSHGISDDCKIFGFVFRNQLRKLVGTLLAGYAEFIKRNPEREKNTKVLLHTHFGEGWDIMRFVEQYNIPKENVLCTYICKETKQYFILPYTGQDIENPKTKRKTLITANIKIGVNDKQFNEIYNIMDGYIHPVTSGGCELPIIEAALTEKIVSTCDYSFGWSVVNKNKKGCIPLEYAFYNEPPTNSNTQFLKSQPFPSSVAKVMQKICEMRPERRREMEAESRKWALENYSITTNGKKVEDFIDAQDLILDESAWDSKEVKKHNPNAIIEEIDDNQQWILSLYKNILDTQDIDEHDDGVKHWMTQLENGVPRKNVEGYFRKVASNEMDKENTQTIDSLFDSVDFEKKLKRLLVVQPESAGDIFMVTSLFQSLRNKFKKEEWKFYFACKPEYMEILAGNEYVDKVIPYHNMMDSQIAMEGFAENKGVVDVCLNPYFSTQRIIDYLHNGHEIIQFDQKL